MGSLIFLFFAPSAYFTFAPFVKDYYADKVRVSKMILKNCEEGKSYYCEEMAEQYRDGDGVEKDYAKAIIFYKKASNLNDSSATYKLGLLYKEGEVISRDFSISTRYYQKACIQGSSTGCVQLGSNYFEGKGIEKDVDKAEGIFFKYCLGNVTESCKRYLDIHETKTLIRYAPYKEFNGVLKDDPSSWSLAFSTPLPGNIVVLKSLFKSSSSLGSADYPYDFKIKMSEHDRKIALSEMERISFESVKYKNFGNFVDENMENYWIYEIGGLFLLEDKRTKEMYIYRFLSPDVK